MQQNEKRKRIRNVIEIVIIAVLCALTVVLDFLPIPYLKDEFRNRMLGKIIQQSCGIAAGILLMLRLNIKLFGRPQKLLYLIPCMLVAIDNFQFSAYFQGEMQLVRTAPLDFILFSGYCLTVGLFEECIFRGVIFSILAGLLPNNKKGLVLSLITSSLVFGLAHLLNGFSLATLLQVGYTTLTGALFGFCLIKTKNIFCCAMVHSVYNFCGLLFDKQMLGSGVEFDLGTILTMVIVCVSVGVFLLIKLILYKEEERVVLYEKLGVRAIKEPKESTKSEE